MLSEQSLLLTGVLEKFEEILCLAQYVVTVRAAPHVKKVTFMETSLYFSWKNQRGFLLGVLYKFCSNIFPNTLYSGFLIIIIEYKGNIIDLYHPSLDFPTGHQLNNIIYNLSHDMNHRSVLAPFQHSVNRLSRWVIWFLIYCGESWCGINSI